MFLPLFIALLVGLPPSDEGGLEPGPLFSVVTGIATPVRPVTDGVVLRADVRVASPGGTVMLILENGEDGPIGFNLCDHTLEVQTGGEWQTVDRSRICVLSLDTMGPGQAATRPVTLPRDLAPGLYRFRLSVRLLDGGGHQDHLTQAFRVESRRIA